MKGNRVAFDFMIKETGLAGGRVSPASFSIITGNQKMFKKGSQHINAKITKEVVLFITAVKDVTRPRDLAQFFNISTNNVYKIQNKDYSNWNWSNQ